MDPTVYGLLIIVAAGVIGSATLLPMKFVTAWSWQNMWLLYASFAYLIFPLLVAWITIPGLAGVYGATSPSTVLSVMTFGAGWGLSVVMLGLAVARVGLAVSTGIIMGCSIALGSLLPLFWVEGNQFATSVGWRILAADAVILCGVALCARAGYLRDRRVDPTVEAATADSSGLLICFLAGLLTPLLNLALASGESITRLAVDAGAAPHQAANGVWGLAVSAGAVPSIAYCLMLLGRHRTWREFVQPVLPRNATLCIMMAVFFITATVGYGMGALEMGALGPALGWPVYISTLIIGNNFWGWLTGEWRAARKTTLLLMVVGLAIQVLGIVMLFAKESPTA